MNKTMKKIFLYSFPAVAVAIIYCSVRWLTPLELSPVEMVKWVESPENGLQVSVTQGSYKLSLQFRPHPYIVARELHKTEVSEGESENVLHTLGDLEYYILSVTPPVSVTKKNVFQEEPELMSFGLQERIKMVQDEDTLHCVMYHLVNTTGVTPRRDILMGFQNPAGSFSGSRCLLFPDVFTERGFIRLEFPACVFRRLPVLKTTDL
jgi:hypothetical protein